jgi:hypothetical protein
MKPQLHIRPFDHSNLHLSDMRDLSYLILPIYIQDPKNILRSVSQREWAKYWFGIAFISVFILMATLIAAALNLYCVLGILPIVFLFLRTTISSQEMNRNISRISANEQVGQLNRARKFLRHTPFIMRRNNALFENLPQLILIEKLLIRCQEGSDNSCMQLSANRNALEILQQQKIKTDHIMQLEVRIEVLTEVVQEFEGVYRILLGAQNRIHQERERLRMFAQNSKITSKVEVYDNSPILRRDEEKLTFYENILLKSIEKASKMELLWQKRYTDKQQTTRPV